MDKKQQSQTKSRKNKASKKDKKKKSKANLKQIRSKFMQAKSSGRCGYLFKKGEMKGKICQNVNCKLHKKTKNPKAKKKIGKKKFLEQDQWPKELPKWLE
jgi:hypothetical protein